MTKGEQPEAMDNVVRTQRFLKCINGDILLEINRMLFHQLKE